MRDLILLGLLVPLCLMSLKRPWIGIIAWVWVSLMNPHRYTYGFAYSQPWAQIIAVCFFVGLLFERKRYPVFAGSPVVLLAAFCAWITISWLMGVDVDGDFEQWTKVAKIMLMVFMAFAVMRTKEHIFALVWVCALSIGLLGAKGGIFTIAHGGVHHVEGPPGSLIGDNNEFALAVVCIIPLLNFLRQQVLSRTGKNILLGLTVLCAASALGSQSRGALLAITAMLLLMWWRGGSRLGGAVVIGGLGVLLVGFMPDEWGQRMNTIGEYADDRSSMNRISAWWTAWGIAKNYVFGAGMRFSRPYFFEAYSPMPENGVWAAHSIYFQMLGNHGFIGLILFLLVLYSIWASAVRTRKAARNKPELLWCLQLASMCQASLIGFVAGGAFLSLAYFDYPYYLLVIVVLVEVWVKQERWREIPAAIKRRWTIPGLGVPQAAAVVQFKQPEIAAAMSEPSGGADRGGPGTRVQDPTPSGGLR